MSALEIVDYVPDKTLTGLQNALARKAHYESELIRVDAHIQLTAHIQREKLETYINTRNTPHDRTKQTFPVSKRP